MEVSELPVMLQQPLVIRIELLPDVFRFHASSLDCRHDGTNERYPSKALPHISIYANISA